MEEKTEILSAALCFCSEVKQGNVLPTSYSDSSAFAVARNNKFCELFYPEFHQKTKLPHSARMGCCVEERQDKLCHILYCFIFPHIFVVREMAGKMPLVYKELKGSSALVLQFFKQLSNVGHPEQGSRHLLSPGNLYTQV